MNKTNIGSIALWYNGDSYGILNDCSSAFIGPTSLLAKLVGEFNNIYLRQSESVPMSGYLIDPTNSSYVTGGPFTVNILVQASLDKNESVKKLPDYLLNIEETVTGIINMATDGEQLEPTKIGDSEEATAGLLAKLMHFEVNEEQIIDIPLTIEDRLTDMSPIFSEVQQVSSNPLIQTPVIIDQGKVYQEDNNGNAINEQYMYTYEEDGMRLLQTSTDDTLRRYTNTFNIKKINGDEYHLCPKFSMDSANIDAASDGNKDSNTILDFSGMKMIKLRSN